MIAPSQALVRKVTHKRLDSCREQEQPCNFHKTDRSTAHGTLSFGGQNGLNLEDA